MRNPTRLVVIVGAVIVVIAAVAAFLPQALLSRQLQSTDSLLTAALPTAKQLASGSDSGVNTSLSNIYIARVDAKGLRQEIVRPLVRTGVPGTPPGGLAATSGITTVASQSGRGSWRAEIVPLSHNEGVLVAVPYDSVNDTDRPFGVALQIARIVVLAFAALSGWLIVRFGLRQIREVTRVANAISMGDRSRRLAAGPPTTGAGRLALAFNEMLDEQHASEDRLRTFVADASHELRNPVAAIAGFADLYRHGAITPDQMDEVMRRIGQESARMRGLVEDMLLLAKLDETQPADTEQVNLSTLAHDAAFDAAARYPSRDIRTDAAELTIEANEAQIRQVFANVVSNALAYTTGAVTITVATVSDEARITVDDEGPGLEPDAVARMFHRFWRGDVARSTSGTGLGLAVVRGIVLSHNGTITVISDPATGTSVIINLPLRGQETDR